MDCDILKIKLSGMVVLFSNFFGKIEPFLPDLRSFVEASIGLRYTKSQIVWDRCPISLFFWENWTFFANFLEKTVVLAEDFCGCSLLFDRYHFRRSKPLNLMKTSSADLP